MGEVYLAKRSGPQQIERLCVIKTLREDLSSDPAFVARFLDEARVVVQLQHANLCTVFDVGNSGRTHFLVMEHLFGVSLRALSDHAEIPALGQSGLAYYVLHEVLEGLDYAHRHKDPITGQPLNLVHRDVSPHNIMLTYEGEVKLIDFGLAQSEQKTEQTESNVVMGKVHYMAPEQARGDAVDARCDQFSAAIVGYELLTQRRFYDDRPSHAVWGLASEGGYLPPGFASLPAAVGEVLQRALAPAPSDRFESCGAFKAALVQAAGEVFPKDGRAGLRGCLSRHLAEEKAQQQRRIAALSQQTGTVAPARHRAGDGAVDPEATLTDSHPSASPTTAQTPGALAAKKRAWPWWAWPLAALICAAAGYGLVLMVAS